MISLCLTENTLRRARKATRLVAACIYIKRPFLKPFFNWNAFIIQCLVHANHMTKYHPYYEGRKNNWIFTCSPTVQGPLQLTTHNIFMAYYRPTPLEVSVEKPFLDSTADMKSYRTNLNYLCHLAFPPNNFQNWGDLQRESCTTGRLFLWCKIVTTHHTSPVGHL